MPAPEHLQISARSHAADFATTRWTLVVQAGRRSTPDADQALATLCQAYWYPLYAYVRRRVKDVHEAQDLTQEFFARLLEKEYLTQAQPERGRFRAFLLTSFKHFLSKEREKARAQKRGGGKTPVSLDFEAGESRLSFEPADTLTPEQIYERQWATALLGRVMERLKQEHERQGKSQQFERLKLLLAGENQQVTYAVAAASLGTTQSAVKMAAHRLRKRYRELLRLEIAQTVASPEEVDDELASLLATYSE
jgi:RNA polymerase sigma-70 factor (ECF subfamily)